MFRKDVTQAHPTGPRRRVSDIGNDKKKFSSTADRTHVANSQQGRPMRGGIRL